MLLVYNRWHHSLSPLPSPQILICHGRATALLTCVMKRVVGLRIYIMYSEEGWIRSIGRIRSNISLINNGVWLKLWLRWAKEGSYRVSLNYIQVFLDSPRTLLRMVLATTRCNEWTSGWCRDPGKRKVPLSFYIRGLSLFYIGSKKMIQDISMDKQIELIESNRRI